MSRHQYNVARANALAIWEHPDDPHHGTLNGYMNLRCRCELCRTANTERVSLRRLQWEDTLPADDPRHGLYGTYTNYRCRCAKCRAANRIQRASWVARRKR